MNSLHNQTVLLVGLGESGLACARWIHAQGAKLCVVDTREQPPGLQLLTETMSDLKCLHSIDNLEWSFDRVVVSPGLAPTHPLMEQVLALANQHGTAVESELDLFADVLMDLSASNDYQPKVIGITGTNGKTTTTNMVACLVEFAGKTVKAAGNIGPAALCALREALEENALPQVWVLELSSFQLHWTSRLKCDAATVLNVTQDHLDWHGTMQSYSHDKQRIFSAGCTAVVNRDDPFVARMPLPEASPSIEFGLGVPVKTGDLGLVREGGMLWLAQAFDDAQSSSARKRKPEELPVYQKLLMPIDALQVVGLHNAANALAALALCCAIDLPMAKLLHGLRAYHGEPHRMEHVLQLDGIDYFDDSKGTNVGATVAALNGLERDCILIAGGDGKGQDFNPLCEPVARYCKAVLLIGKDAHLIEQALRPSHVVCEHATSLDQAVQRANAIATAGQCVLLSPACASLDMFKNYAHRAQVFVDAVKSIALERGQPC